MVSAEVITLCEAANFPLRPCATVVTSGMKRTLWSVVTTVVFFCKTLDVAYCVKPLTVAYDKICALGEEVSENARENTSTTDTGLQMMLHASQFRTSGRLRPQGK